MVALTTYFYHTSPISHACDYVNMIIRTRANNHNNLYKNNLPNYSANCFCREDGLVWIHISGYCDVAGAESPLAFEGYTQKKRAIALFFII